MKKIKRERFFRRFLIDFGSLFQGILFCWRVAINVNGRELIFIYAVTNQQIGRRARFPVKVAVSAICSERPILLSEG